MNGWLITGVLATYVGLLFVCAFLGEHSRLRIGARSRRLLFALTLGVYCTSWTFYGAVGAALQQGWLFLTIYLGPLLFLWLGHDIWRRLVQIRTNHSMSSIADFLAARYGKSPVLAALVTVFAVISVLPYFALQLQAISLSVAVMMPEQTHSDAFDWPSMGVFALTAGLAALAMLFGTRHRHHNERHGGLMLAVALESAVKLVALLLVGGYALWHLLHSTAPLPSVPTLALPNQIPGGFLAQTLVAALAMICLPRQFHVAVVEASHLDDLKAARPLFASYLVLTVLAILPIAWWAGAELNRLSNPDMAVLLLPLLHDQHALALVAFLGGFSAATGMLLVASVALSIMLSNDLILPALWRLGWLRRDTPNLVDWVRWIRRLSLLGLMLLAYAMYRLFAGDTQLASIGVLSFAAVAQFAPALIGGLYWRGGSKTGVMAGLLAGFVLWAITLLWPTLLRLGIGDLGILERGVFGWSGLRPEALFGSQGLDPLTHGVLWSLSLNLLLYVVVSLRYRPSMREQMQALAFLQPDDQAKEPLYVSTNTAPSRFQLIDLYTLAEQITGTSVAHLTFKQFAAQLGQPLNLHQPADGRWWRMTEQLLAASIGTATARSLLSSALHDKGMGIAEIAGLLDHASQWQRFNQALLATMMNHIAQGVSVVDAELKLVAWNRRYLELFDYPSDLVYVGCPIAHLIQYNAERGECGTGDVRAHIDKRLHWMRLGNPHVFERIRKDGRVIEMRGQPIQGGGFVTTFADITAFRQTEAALELRVLERTEQLETALQQQADARQLADQANQSKSRFVAAASHDLLQPMHAARLFTASLADSALDSDAQQLVQQLDRSLHGAESMLSALLDIARLDTNTLQPSLEAVELAPLLADLGSQYHGLAEQRGLQLRIYSSPLWVHTDPQWLRRMVQNLLSNALRYTATGRVVMGVRQSAQGIRLFVCDTGLGIDTAQQSRIFEEFQRGGNQSPWGEQGLGLGLAITFRMASRLGHGLNLDSQLGKGSRFWLTLPAMQPPVASKLTPVANTAAPTLAGLRVLCLDNDPDILSGMHSLLGRWGCQIYTAKNIDQALQLQQQYDAQVWLVDQHLDDQQSGFQLLQQYLPSNVMAALITADSDPALPQQVKQQGWIFLKKPLKPAALRAFLSQIKGNLSTQINN